MSKTWEKKGAGKQADGETANRDSFLETIEAFIVAFILAFVFRAYVVEAFVIPTGSMARRLNGDHFEYVCAKCGYHYSVGLDEWNPRDHGGRLPPSAITADPVCPLCFSRDVTDARPQLDYGDRILVLKYFYHFFPPKRWDVIVFKYPVRPEQNFIKRLIGLPGDTVEIRDGDVYINNEIARKPDRAQESLWMPVFDSDYPDLAHLADPRWKVEPAETKVQGSTIQLPMTVTPRSAETAYLTFQQRDQFDNPAPIMDFYAYDDLTNYSGASRADDQIVVTDLDLRATVELKSAGTVELVLRAYDDEFHFFVPTAGLGKVRIVHDDLSSGVKRQRGTVEGPPGLLAPGTPADIEVANVDHRLILKVNGQRVIDRNADGRIDEDDDYPYTPAVPRSQWTGDPKGWTDVKVGFTGATAVVSHLRIDRDVYYTFVSPQRSRSGDDSNLNAYAVDGHPYTVKATEYFALGDNSPRSADSRYWGPVPQANLVGKAFLVYWPAAGKRYGIPIRAVPDVKAFRLIR